MEVAPARASALPTAPRAYQVLYEENLYLYLYRIIACPRQRARC